jgi:hypothetical protein
MFALIRSYGLGTESVPLPKTASVRNGTITIIAPGSMQNNDYYLIIGLRRVK